MGCRKAIVALIHEMLCLCSNFEEEILILGVGLDLQIRSAGLDVMTVVGRETHGMQGRTISQIYPQAILAALGARNCDRCKVLFSRMGNGEVI